ncbi:hypothetical protein [Ruminococcus intestinalis]|jgi:hypothetical protein|uniref:hypothetical protein n=1 Tax=Ruminococcus intestinalis TaxID=2763066 RepID=UPI003F7EE4A4
MNTSFESTNLLEHLGIYDFLNVLLAGSIFTFGICIIDSDIKELIWSNITFLKGLEIILLIYIIGLLLQELGAIVDNKLFKIYNGMSSSILNGNVDAGLKKETSNKIIKNPIVLLEYRNFANELLENLLADKNKQKFENKYVNGYVFSICQYYVSITGKDKKTEKLRALVDMSITLMTCFLILSILSIVFIFTQAQPSINIFKTIGLSDSVYNSYIGLIAFAIIFLSLGIFFLFRAKRVMKNFLLVLLGTYNALVSSLEYTQQQSIIYKTNRKKKDGESAVFQRERKNNRKLQ